MRRRARRRNTPGRKPARLRSDIAWSTPDRIGVLGHDLVRELIGRVNLGDMGFLEITGRLPNARESRTFNALLVTLVEHGIVPSTLATRLTYTGAPESLQAAVAAGLLGLGSVFVGSIEGAARMLGAALPDPKAEVALPALADRIVAEHARAGRVVPGLGHPIHKPVDPRVPRLFAVARANGFGGPYLRLMRLVARRAEKSHGRALPINATGAIGAICCEMGLPWQACRGLGVMARAVGLVGHVLEESRRPIAREVWHRTEAEATAHARGRLRRKRP
ncbi:MAG: citryl-CoA lyase [Burkholderiales bacterium]|nr:citryl-CoA lyase [Burkholderiales bacterium]